MYIIYVAMHYDVILKKCCLKCFQGNFYVADKHLIFGHFYS